MSNVCILLSTIDSAQAAEDVASKLVEEHLAACVNILPGVSSYYRWEGEVQNEQEFLLILKTSTDRVDDLMDRMKTLHPYEVPEIVSIPVEAGYQPYLDWVVTQTASSIP
jgi:periplasmic divalent cation tolerance protein